MIKLTNNFFSE